MSKHHWDNRINAYVERPDVDAFLEEIIAVCKRHHLSIAHEDNHGAFIIEPFAQDDIDWILSAMVTSGEETNQ